MTAVDRLRIKTLGNLAIVLGEEGVPNFASRKAEALLVYLACNPRSHPREVLADLLWDDRSQRQSMANLRVVLSSLRKEVGPYVSITRTIAAVDPDADLWLDAAELEAAVGALQEDESPLHPASVPELQEALALYEGDFLAGYFLPQAVGFETWAAAERERLHRLAITGLRRLGRWHLEQGEYQPAIRWATRLVAVDELAESGHRQLMGALALSGRRTEALRQYEAFRQLLQDELGILPSEETESLYEAIRTGETQRALALLAPAATPQILAPSPRSPISSPAFLRDYAEIEREEPVFIGRELELARLHDELDLALESNGRILFVTGDAGSGKSSLMRSFAREASTVRQDTLVAWGACSAFAGQGDPYLPFRDILATLTGDVEVALAADTLTSQQASVLWQAMPAAVNTLLDNGPDLLNTMVPGSALLSRLSSALPATDDLTLHLQQQLSRGQAVPGEMEQLQLFEQVIAFLRRLSEQQPILLFLDDLQWADQASLSLLFHLGRRLSGIRLFLVGAYRTDEVALGRGGERHPLEKVIAESQRAFGQVMLDLEDVDAERNRAFVDALLDSEPNALDDSFRAELHALTGGHPLFTVETLRFLQERGDLIQDDAGVWQTAPGLAWDGLPDRVEGIIGERIARLDDELREILTVAAVEGEKFTAQVVARLQALLERKLLALLSRELEKRHRLVRERQTEQVEGRLISRFRFGHAVIQQYLYGELGTAERRLLHSEIGTALEELYGDRANEIAVALAYHFVEAEVWGKALDYLIRAGDNARFVFANQVAAEYYTRALELCGRLDNAALATSADILRRRGWVQDSLENSWADFDSMLNTARKLGDRHLEAKALAHRGRVEFFQHDLEAAEKTLESALDVAGESSDDVRFLANSILVNLYLNFNRHAEAKVCFDAAEALAPSIDESFSLNNWSLIGVLAHNWEGEFEKALKHSTRWRSKTTKYSFVYFNQLWTEALVLGGKGDYERALALLEDSIATAKRIYPEDPPSPKVLNTMGWIYGELQDMQQATYWNRQSVQAARQLELNSPEAENNARLNLGDYLLAQGRLNEAERHFQHVEEIVRNPWPEARWMIWRYSQHLFHSYGELWLVRGDSHKALSYADECLELAEKSNSRKYIIKGRRLRGQALMAQGKLDKAERELDVALIMAQKVGNPPQLWKTHAAVGDLSLAQERPGEAHQSYGAAKAVIYEVAINLSDESLRETFLNSEHVQGIRQKMDKASGTKR